MPSYTIKNFRGGKSDEDNIGIKGSFKYGQGLSIHKKADSLSCQQALKKESGAIVTDLILFMVQASDGNSYHFGDSGKIYKRTSAAVWTLVYTDTNGAIKGAAEWNGNLYWATDTKLSKKPIPGATDWSDVVHDWDTLTASDWHTMKVGAGVQGDLFICNGENLAMVDYSGVFTAEAVKIIPGNITKCLESDDIDIIIGSVVESDAEKGYLWAWNTQLGNWRKRKKIPVSGVNAIVTTERMLAQAGDKGGLFFSDMVNKFPIGSFAESGIVRPGAVTNKGNLALFGLYASDYCGVYSYGRTQINRSKAINLEYILSMGKLTGVEIGAISMAGSDLLVSWKDGTTYGVDVIDSANKADAIYESLDFDAGSPTISKVFTQVKLTMVALPASCSVKVKYRVNKKGAFVAAKLGDGTEAFDVTDGTKAIFETGGEGEIYEVRVELYSSGNTTPEILSVSNYFDPFNEY